MFMRHLTPKELRERNEAIMFRLLPHPTVLTCVAFVGTLIETKQLRAALKEAQYVWKRFKS